MQLQPAAAKAGGAVHVLLGNHEAMNLMGDLRSVADEEFLAFATESEAGDAEQYPEKPIGFAAHRRAFAATGTYGRWLLSLPSIIRVNDTLFVHGGLSELTSNTDLATINQALTQELRQAVKQGHMYAPAETLLGDQGPLWYRGTAACHGLIETPILTRSLRNLGAKRVVIAHTPTPSRKITQRLGAQVIAIDTGLLASVYKGKPYLLQITQDAINTLNLAGETGTPVEIHSVLNGSVQAEHRLAEQTPRVLNTKPESTDFHPASKKNAHRAEALWRLDRMLGVNMVPLSLAVKLNGRWGYLEFVQGNWLDEQTRQQESISRPAFCYPDSVFAITTYFDALTRSNVRDADSILYRRGTWQVRLSDQASSLTKSKRLIPLGDFVAVPELLANRLRSLTKGKLTELLGDLISDKEIDAILVRRNQILRSTGQTAS